MNACRLAILMPVMLVLLVGMAVAQVPGPTIPTEEPPALEAQPPTPPTGIPDLGFPGQPPAPTDSMATPPGMPPELPNLQVPPPTATQGLGIPPSQPQIRQSDNPLLKLFDADGDGFLSGDEVDAAPARLWELDRNMDAELSADELGLVLAPRWQERRRAVRGYLPTEPLPAEPMPVAPDLPVLPERKLGDERPQFEVYPLRGLDPGRTLAALQQLLEDQPSARLTFDGRSQSILALAPPSSHAQIRKTLADLLAGDRTGIPGLAPGQPSPAAPNAALPVVPRVVPLYNARAREILRIVKQVYRDRITEPRTQPPVGDPRFPGAEFPPIMNEPTVPAGRMVIGEGAEPNTIVISAQNELFFEVLDLIERLDASQEPPADEMEIPPGN